MRKTKQCKECGRDFITYNGSDKCKICRSKVSGEEEIKQQSFNTITT